MISILSPRLSEMPTALFTSSRSRSISSDGRAVNTRLPPSPSVYVPSISTATDSCFTAPTGAIVREVTFDTS